ncbi:MAG TPA: hypothetical protein ENH29_05800 [Bacteroidetes bacterium]|nr:hypothetical protein [Bacteroidota bacterium]
MKNFTKTILASVLILTFATVAFSQVDIGFKGIGGKVGFVSPEDPIGSTLGLGVVADLGTITPDIHLSAFVDFWNKSYDSGSGFGYTAKWTWTEMVFGAAAKYYFPMEGSKFKPYAGGGLGFAYGKSKWTSDAINTGFGTIGGGSYSSSNTNIGFRILAGADYELSPGLTGFAEATYHIDGVDYFGIFVGVTKTLGQ